MIRLLLILVGSLAFMVPARAEIPTEPILRLEPGMHAAPIVRIDVDAEERFLVTGSVDNTARVWALEDGRLLRTLRLPIGEANVGSVLATGISPDGAMIAAGGSGPVVNDHSIYIFERAGGRIIDRIDDLPSKIQHLAFSADGRYLVAALRGRNGIRIYETRTFRKIAVDLDYRDDSYWAAFDRAGRLATSSFDGRVRLYDPSFRLLELRDAPGGERPIGVAFSPDDARIAVGYEDSTRVDVLDARTLKLIFSADTSVSADTTQTIWDFSVVAWSPDGAFLYAGGRSQQYLDGRWQSFVRRWSASGRGEYEDIALGESTIQGLRPVGGGSLAFGDQYPTLGVVGPGGRISWRREGVQPDFRGQNATFAVSADGTRVGFGFEPFDQSPAVFDLLSRRLTLNPKADPSLAIARTSAAGLDIKDWEYGYTKDWKYGDTPKLSDRPTLNGALLPLEPHEAAASLVPVHKA